MKKTIQQRDGNKLSLPSEDSGDDRLFNEINLLRLEGYYFCLDPRAATKRKTKLEFIERIKIPKNIIEYPITIDPHPDYGYPSVLAYKVLQVILKKLSDYGYPFSNTVSFSQRELARLVGRSSYGGANQEQFYRAIKQLQRTEITCWFYQKEQDNWAAASLNLLTSSLFSGKKDRITQCCVHLHPLIVQNFNNRFVFCLNYRRMETLEPISTALFKHLFYHFSNIYSQKKQRIFSYNKDYKDICITWLGSLTVLKYKSKILREQLGSHLKALKDCELISRYEIEKNARGDGFVFVFYPGNGFFKDYQEFYGGHLQLQFDKASDERRLQKPMEIVNYFYKKLYQTDEISDLVFSDKETEFASSLLEKHSLEEVFIFIDYSLREAKNTDYNVKTFVGIKQYYPAFLSKQRKLVEQDQFERKRREDALNRQHEDQYRVFYRQRLSEIRTQISPEEIASLEDSARLEVQAKYPNRLGQDILVRVHVDTLLAKKYQIPSFEEWVKHQSLPS
jgi:hypothetical protein